MNYVVAVKGFEYYFQWEMMQTDECRDKSWECIAFFLHRMIQPLIKNLVPVVVWDGNVMVTIPTEWSCL